MISRLRRWIAIAIALTVTLVTLGRVQANWTGRSTSEDGADDPNRAATTSAAAAPRHD